MEDSTTAEVGARVERYLILSVLSRPKQLFVAYDPDLDRNVVLKLMPPRRSQTPRARRKDDLQEAQALARLSHANVVAVYDVGTWEGAVYMALEHVEGRSITEWATRRGASWQDILAALVQAGQGLAAAHDADIAHLDFTASNILVATNGRVRVVDFSLAQRIGVSSMSLSGSSPAVPTAVPGAEPKTIGRRPEDPARPRLSAASYLAAECGLADELGARTDRFAFCVVAWQALFGAPPFVGRDRNALRDAVTHGRIAAVPGDSREASSVPSSVPSYIRAALLRGLDPNGRARFDDMRALLAALTVDPRRATVRALLAVGGVLLVGGLAIGLDARRRSREAKCELGSGTLERAWSAQSKARTRRVFETVAPTHGAAVYETVRAQLDTRATTWRQMWTRACQATARREQSKALLERRTLCLDQRLVEFSAVTAVLTSATSEVVARAQDAVTDLPSVSACADVERLMRDQPSVNAQDVGALATLGELLARARALELAGEFDGASAAAEQAAALAEPLGATSELAKAHLRLAGLVRLKGDLAGARGHLDAALWSAERAGDDALRFATFLRLAWLVGHLQGDHAQANFFSQAATQVMSRLGATPQRLARVSAARARIELDRGELSQAGASCRQLLVALNKLEPSERGGLGAAHFMLAQVDFGLGRFETALPRFEQVRGIREGQLGLTDPEIGAVLAYIGACERAVGEAQPAREDLSRAIELMAAGARSDRPALAFAYAETARSLDEQGEQASAAEAYVRALRIWRNITVPHRDAPAAFVDAARLQLRYGEVRVAGTWATEALALLSIDYASPRIRDASGLRMRARWVLRTAIAELRAASADAKLIAGFERALATAEDRPSSALSALNAAKDMAASKTE